MAQVTIIDGIYVIKKKIGRGGMAAIYLAEVDQSRFDYTTLYAYTQVQGETHTERRIAAEELAEKLRHENLDLATIRSILLAQNIPIPGEEVAIKVATGDVNLPRFEGEWKNLLCLNHDNVIKVYGGGIYKKRPYYAMELLDNLVSPKKIKDEFTIKQKLQVLVQAGRGLDYLHKNGLIHRDIKPDNMVTCEIMPGEYMTKVTDLGLAKNLDDDLGLTMSNAVMGTPYYMSPEQLESTCSVDHKADIYSLGASLYEYVTGIRPYNDKTNIYQIIQAMTIGEKPKPVQEHMPDLPDAIAGIIECAMEWAPEDRYESVADMNADIEAYLNDESRDITASISFVKADKSKSRAAVGGDRYVFEKRRRKKRQPRRTHRKTSTRMRAVGAGAAEANASAISRARRATLNTGAKANWKLYAAVGGGIALLLAIYLAAGSLVASKPKKLITPPNLYARPSRGTASGVAAKPKIKPAVVHDDAPKMVERERWWGGKVPRTLACLY